MGNFLEKNNKKNKYIEIRKLYIDKKYKSLIKAATSYLDNYPNDINVRFMRAKAYRYLNNFNECIDDLKYNLQFGNDPHSVVELYYTYYFLNMYNECLQMLPILYETRYINAYSLSISEIIMKKQLGISISCNNYRNDYLKGQVINYNKDLMVNHISKHLEKNSDDEERSYFQENINLEYLINLVQENLYSSNKANIDEILEIHYFPIYNVGYDKDNVCNYIKVIVIPNTSNIISVYPISNVYNNQITTIEYDYDKLFPKEKVKTISQIDKFYNRYNKQNEH